MSAYLEAIVSLQATLSELAIAQRRLNSIPEWMTELHEEHSGRTADIETVAAEVRPYQEEQKRRDTKDGATGSPSDPSSPA